MTYGTKTVSLQELGESIPLQLDLVGSVINLTIAAEDETITVTGTLETFGMTADGDFALGFQGRPDALAIDADDLQTEADEEDVTVTITFIDYEGGRL